jgi:hypothetical protein
MLNSIISGICTKLNEAFGDDYTIYKEQVAQGLKEPCFFVQIVEPTNTQQLGNRYFRENLFCIQYFPISENAPIAECLSVQDDLFLALEYIMVGEDLQRGEKMRGEFSDGVLNFFVEFNMFVYKTEDLDPMEELEQTNIITKG